MPVLNHLPDSPYSEADIGMGSCDYPSSSMGIDDTAFRGGRVSLVNPYLGLPVCVDSCHRGMFVLHRQHI